MSRPPLLMISGWAHPAECLRPLADALAPAFEPELADASEGAVCARLQKAESPLFLFGWSMGGMIALEAAETWAPRVAGLVLVSSTAKFCPAPGWPNGTPERTVRGMAATIRKKPEELLALFFRNAASPSELTADELALKTRSAVSLGMDHLASGLRYLQLSDCRAAAKALNIPSLVCHGGQDRIIPWQAGRDLGELLSARFAKFDGMGHDLPLRAPQALADEIARFAEAVR